MPGIGPPMSIAERFTATINGSITDAITVELPTPYGVFRAHGFERPSGHVYMALVYGDVDGAERALVRVHSECLTGDALGSLRCDCGVQLREALRTIVASGCGALVYATGHEGRGIGLMNKLRAYLAQENGADTVDANHLLGLPADARDYADAAAVIEALGIRSVRLLTNNPAKADGLRRYGVEVDDIVGLHTSPHRRNAAYLATKTERMGHVIAIDESAVNVPILIDPATLIGGVQPQPDRPAVVAKLAQSLDGRIAARSGDSKWISGEQERAVTHALRAAVDAVVVGAETVVRDDPQLTVRAVAGASPTRVVFDSGLRTPLDSHLFCDGGSTIVMTTHRSDERRREALRAAGVAVEVVADGDGRVDPSAALARLRELGMQVVLIEGGSQLITSLLGAGTVDRMIVSVAPIVIGAGVDAVGDLGIARIADGLRLANCVVARVGDDVITAGDVVRQGGLDPGAGATS